MRARVFKIISLVFALSLIGGANAADTTSAKTTRVPLPNAKIAQGDQCVEPTDVMRRDHMKFILHQRDKTMHEGVRTQNHSLKNCVNCHADPKTNSVLGEDGFCQACHSYAAVKIDCFSCHSASPEKKPAASGVAASGTGSQQ